MGIPVLLAFGLWSTSGVHDGVVTALALTPGSLTWWAAWVVEPGLITVVAAVLVGRAILRTAGGDVDRRALVVMGSALLVSLALSVLPVWPTVWGPEAVAAVVAKSLGPVGAAVTAHLIGMFDDYARDAQPEKGAQSLDEMRLERPVPVGTVPPLPGEDSPQATAVETDQGAAPAVEAPAPGQEPAGPPTPVKVRIGEGVYRVVGGEHVTGWLSAPAGVVLQPMVAAAESSPAPEDSAVESAPGPWGDEEETEYTDPWADRLDEEGEETEPWEEDPFADPPKPTPGERTSIVVPEPVRPLLDTWGNPPILPVDDRGRQLPPKPGEPAFRKAVDLYLDCERHGIPLSGRKLCELNGVNPDNRIWRQTVIRSAKESQAAKTGTATPPLFEHP
ncbi:hypothetical protein [Nocardiopsis sp. FR26]|uniref:hypothetical protein n=1 Tax=Nocardiopsis sp. FR26 TaxID=2605987 RepID=UPI00135BFB73|nr:hypothetical protein [Nocardiopsis sp. FR26]